MEEDATAQFETALDEALRDEEFARVATDEERTGYLRRKISAQREALLADVRSRAASSGSPASKLQSIDALEEERRRLDRRRREFRAVVAVGAAIGVGTSLVLGGLTLLTALFGFVVTVAFGVLVELTLLRRSPARRRVQEFLDAAREGEAEALGKVVREALRIEARALTGGPRYALQLGPLFAPGLAELRQGQAAVRTKAADRLETLLREMRGGSIGLAGPRGVGKTTVMREACFAQPTEAELEAGAKRRHGVLLLAPVRYDAREFLLHLASTICIELLGRGERRRVLEELTRSDTALGRIPPLLRLGGVLLLAGLVACAAEWTGLVDRLTATEVWGLAVAGCGAGLVVLWGLSRLLRVTRRGRRGDVERDAGWLLERIKFQQTISTGWSAGLRLPIGVQGRIDAARSMAAAQLTVPEIAVELAELLTRAGRYEQIVIGIDEIDKIADDAARDFLNELKVVFGIPGCFFLVSVSEDAMSDFERRGLPFRNVFDSSLDEVVNVEFLDAAKSSELLAQRVIGLPEQFALLAHCLGGGLPRDVIRAARDIVETVNTAQRSLSLSRVTQAVVGGDLRAKVDATLHEARKETVEPETGKVLGWLRGIQPPDAEAGIVGIAAAATTGERIDAFQDRVLEHVITAGSDESSRAGARRRLLRGAVELLAYLYYAETLLTFFDDGLVEERLAGWTTRPAMPLEELARARQAFAVSAELAWERVSTARNEIEMGTRDVPAIGERYVPH